MFTRWTDLTSKELEAGVSRGEYRVAVLPVGAVESHGAALPLGTDSFIVKDAIARVEQSLSELHDIVTCSVLLLPTMEVGASDEHSDFCGTLSLSDDTLMRLWTDIASSVNRAGIRKLIVLNGHGGQTQNVEILCRRLRFDHDMLAVGVHLQRIFRAEDLFPAHELMFGVHAGAIETSVLMCTRPELVKRDELADGASNASTWPVYPTGDAVMCGWQSSDLNASGAVGNALLASAANGETILERLTDDLCRVVVGTYEFDLSLLERRRGR